MEIFSGKKSGGGIIGGGDGYERKTQTQTQSAVHIPVLLKEAMDALNIRRGNIYVDGTLGGGGFSEAILKKLDGEGFLVGIDRDFSAVKNVSSKFETEFNTKNFKLFHSNFSKIDEVIKTAGFTNIDGVVLDLGISSIQLESKRGFSFTFNSESSIEGEEMIDIEANIDMRMDAGDENGLTAYDVVNGYPEQEIADIIYKYGDEKFSRRIAKSIIEYRKKNKPIETPSELAVIVRKAVYKGYGKFKRFKTDPATKTFMALRIFVNEEYDSLSKFLGKLDGVLKKDGRAVIISFHSGEDRIVKNFLKNNLNFKLLNKKPIVPTEAEVENNPRSRSAKLRAFYRD
ncbi:MAG: 16S rRNA (cytosine(1402)-N(4))-methyltransferase RsmH [Deltaproteobacteria bacterium]|nr:16S rRNA (cytosine(1402)-N(4))-methyltransferase RsmH [Deltaproteobacteria bacterium]